MLLTPAKAVFCGMAIAWTTKPEEQHPPLHTAAKG